MAPDSHRPPPNTLAPIAGGAVLLFVAIVVGVQNFTPGVVVLGLVGVALVAYGLARRDRVQRYGR